MTFWEIVAAVLLANTIYDMLAFLCVIMWGRGPAGPG